MLLIREGNTEELSVKENFKPISLTLVYYFEDDFLSHLLAYCSLVPIFSVFAVGVVLFFRRELYTGCFFVGILICELLNLILKNLIQQPRPAASEFLGRDDYGMPSDHSQMIFFIGIFLILFIMLRANFQSNLWKWIGCVGIHISACIIAYSR